MVNNSLMPTFNRMLAFDRELDRLVNWNGKRFFVPTVDVIERADAYVISAELPGVEPADVEISVEANTLTGSLLFDLIEEGANQSAERQDRPKSLGPGRHPQRPSRHRRRK